MPIIFQFVPCVAKCDANKDDNMTITLSPKMA